jgi:hypothetical protein
MRAGQRRPSPRSDAVTWPALKPREKYDTHTLSLPFQRLGPPVLATTLDTVFLPHCYLEYRVSLLSLVILVSFFLPPSSLSFHSSCFSLYQCVVFFSTSVISRSSWCLGTPISCTFFPASPLPPDDAVVTLFV